MKQNSTFIRLLSASVVGVVFLALTNQPANGMGKPKAPVVYEEMVVVGDLERRTPNGDPTNPHGVFDPSLEYAADANGSIGWMAYTSAESPFPNTHLAMTTDQGLTWTFIGRVNESVVDFVILENGTAVPGIWHYEVPTLVYDALDTGSEWKLFTHKYFWNPATGNRMLQYGWIVYKYASDPAGLWSDEIFLFSNKQFTAPSYDFALYDLSSFHSDLTDIIVYTEPGSLVKDGVLYLSLAAFVMPEPGKPIGPEKIILLTSPDGALTWEYVGTLLDRSDAKDINHDFFGASSLVRDNATDYLLVEVGKEEVTHNGTYIFRISDIDLAEVERSPKGKNKLVVHKILPLQPAYSDFGGMSDYDSFNTDGGIVFPQMDLNDPNDPPEVWKIFNTGEGL